jgi:hypothetical protein
VTITVNRQTYRLSDEFELERFLTAWNTGVPLQCWRWRIA